VVEGIVSLAGNIPMARHIFHCRTLSYRSRGSVVVKALCYEPGGCGFDIQ
jgi:hypothetical protein